MNLEGQRRRADRTDVVATVVGILAALLGAWGAKAAVVRVVVEDRVASYTHEWPVGEDVRQRLGRLMERELRPLWNSHQAGARPRLRQNQGYARLSDAELGTYQALRKRIAFASERACPCQWEAAGCSLADNLDGLAQLTDGELSAWYHLVAAAMLAAREPGEPPPFVQEDLDAGMGSVMTGLWPHERQRVFAVQDRSATTPADRCFAARALLSGVEAMEPAQRARFTRALLLGYGGR